MRMGSTSYARTFCRRPTSEVSAAARAKSLLGFDWTRCVGVHSKRVNTVKKSARVLASSMTYAQLQYWLQKAYGRSCTYGLGRFTVLALLQEGLMSKWRHWSEVKTWNFTIKTFETYQFNESRILFVGLNMNTIVQEKTPETCTLRGWCFKCWNSVVVCPPPY